MLVLALACGDDDTPPTGFDAGPCTLDEECDDGNPCNGTETCEAGACVRLDTPPDCDDGVACTVDRCVAALGGCVHTPTDDDGDGSASTECGGDDCDDADPLRFPGALEICDPDGVDEDCDPTTFGGRDLDGDGAIDARCCNGEACGTDCDDMHAGVHPAEAEECDGLDNDCDGATDEGVLQPFYADVDRDGYGAGDAVMACFADPGFAARDGDCDDEDEARNPGLPERCSRDARDEDCDGVVDPPERCACTGDDVRACQDGEGAPLMGACASGVERCVDGSYAACTIVPTNERCDGSTDEDCDGVVDEDVTVACFVDFDNDGFAPAGITVDVCPDDARPGRCPAGTTARAPVDEASTDCDDRRGTSRPTAPERPANEVDDDCDGRVDEGEE